MIVIHYYNTANKVYKSIASEILKSLNNLNPNFVYEMFQVKDITTGRGGGVLPYLGMVGRFRGDDPHF